MTAKRPVVPETLFAFEQISDPQISPDGSMVAYVVSKADLKANKSRSSLWLAPTDGGTPHRLTNPVKGSDRAPRWSPDGEQLAFVSDRSGQPQLWVISRAGGEARQIETGETPQGAPVWSPDGSRLAFTANVFAKPDDWTPYFGAPAKDRERAEKAANYDSSRAGKEEGEKPSDVKVITRFPFRRDGFGYVGDKYSHLFLVPADGSDKAVQVSSGDFDHNGPCWSLDGEYLYASARRIPAPEETRTDLWQFEVTTGTPKLVYESPTNVFDLQVSPLDGGLVAFGSRSREHGWSGQSCLMLLGVDDGQVADLTGKLDRPLGPHGMSDVRTASGAAGGRWAPDGSGLYFLAGERGNAQLCFVLLDSCRITRLTAGDDRTVSAFSVGPKGNVALLIGDGTHPDELYLLKDGALRPLTDQNPVARELALVEPERFTYIGADGWQMEGWVIRPVGYQPGRRYPTVLAIHGGPHGQFGSDLMIQYQMFASAGFAVVLTNPRGSATYGQKFASAVVGDWGGKDFADIMAGVDAVIAMGIADPDRLGVLGWSYGGYMTAWTITQTDRFKAAITGAPVVDGLSMIGTTDIAGFAHWHLNGNPWEEGGTERLLGRSSIRYVDRVTTPTMVVCGESDFRCPISQAEEFYLALKRLGKVPAVHIRYPGEFHGISQPAHKLDRYERYLAWFQYWLNR